MVKKITLIDIVINLEKNHNKEEISQELKRIKCNVTNNAKNV